MPAILFGSIGSIADTSELQRQSYNQAFKLHQLDWNWERAEYLKMLEQNGGKQRIENYAASLGYYVDAAAIHKSKSEIFQQLLQQERVLPRGGVVETIAQAHDKDIKIALVTTTSQQNVNNILAALSDRLDSRIFKTIINVSDVEEAKPASDAYILALQQLNETADNCVAIEDNLGGVEAALNAGISCIAFPNQNTAHHDFSAANMQVDTLEFASSYQLIESNKN
ncbi:MAG: HAD-IA family hydrolase [Cyanobacteria bacterium J06621_8]